MPPWQVRIAAGLLAIGTAQAPSPSMLGFVDAAKLSEFCAATGAQAASGRTICLSYVTGAADQLLAEQALRAPSERTICVPRDITAELVMRNVTAYAAWSKAAQGVSGASFVKYAMEQAFPCDDIDHDDM